MKELHATITDLPCFHCALWSTTGESTTLHALESGHEGPVVIRKATQWVHKMMPSGVHKQSCVYWKIRIRKHVL